MADIQNAQELQPEPVVFFDLTLGGRFLALFNIMVIAASYQVSLHLLLRRWSPGLFS